MFRKLIWKYRTRLFKPNQHPLRKGKYNNFIFIHINKTGGTSIAKAIGLPTIRHLPVKKVIDIVGQKEFEEAFKFTAIRNPWDKVVSQYKYRVNTNQTAMKSNPISFKNWVVKTYGEQDEYYLDKPKMFAAQSDWLKDYNNQLPNFEIIRFESLHADFQKIAKQIGVKSKLRHLNATQKDVYTDYYDEKTKSIIEDWYKEDIERFGYKYKGNIDKMRNSEI